MRNALAGTDTPLRQMTQCAAVYPNNLVGV